MADADKHAAPGLPRRSGAGAEPEVRFLCPECQAPAADLEAHLRQAHKIYVFRGTKRSGGETLGLLLGLVLSSRPDAEAWDTLAAIAREEHGPRADFYLASLLSQSLGRLSPERRTQAVEGLGPAIGKAGAAWLVAVLASDAELASRHLALAALAHMAPPLPAELHQPLRGLLLDHRLPADLQVAATAVLIRGAGADSPLAADFLEKLTVGLGKAKSLERLRQLEKLLGPTPAIDALCSVLEERPRLRCPRCHIELRRLEMAQHLWQQHQFVLDAHRVRDPWSVVEDWLDAYRARGAPDLMERCRLLAQHLEGDRGLAKVKRLMAARGIRDADAHHALVEEARATHASLCPECYALVPVPQPLPPFFINQYRGRLSARGYRVEIAEHGLRTRLEVALPTGPVLSGPEPHRRWTRQGATVFLVGPLVVLALAVAVGLPPLDQAPLLPLLPVLALLGLAFGLELLVRWLWRPRLPPADRACHYAWTLLAPRLHAGGFDSQDSAFLAGLARHSDGRGYSLLRAKLLSDLAQRTEVAALKQEALTEHLAALRRLQAEDAVRAGEDPLPALARSLGLCFGGQLPFAYAQELLRGWQTELWTRGNLLRLRVLLCAAAFEAGFEVRTLLDAARTAPALAGALGTDQPERLAALRLLWSLRAARPWAGCGPAKSVFDIAAEPRWGRLLTRYPDLLLVQDEPDWPALAPAGGDLEPVRILLCGRGVVLQDVLFDAEPLLIDVINRPTQTELLFSPHRFRAPGRVEALVSCMERWFRWAFREFLPQVGRASSWQESDRTPRVRALGAVRCPQCRHPLLPRVGEVGLEFDQAKEMGHG